MAESPVPRLSAGLLRLCQYLAAALCIFSFISAITVVAASPVSRNVAPVSDEELSLSPVGLVFALCTPFAVLGSAKWVYVRWRRAETIHLYGHLRHRAHGGANSSNEGKEEKGASEEIGTKADRLLGLGFNVTCDPAENPNTNPRPTRRQKLKLAFVRKLDIILGGMSGYVVGALGSPQWETRMRVRVDTTRRKKWRPESSFVQSPSPSVYASFTRSRSTGGNRASATSASQSKFSASRSHSASEKFSSTRSRSASDKYSSARSRSMSVSFLEMSTPDANSSASAGIASCSLVHPSSPPCGSDPNTVAISHSKSATREKTDANVRPESITPKAGTESTSLKTGTSATGSTRSRRRASVSPTLMQVMEPVIAAWRRSGTPKEGDEGPSTSDSSQSRSHSITPAFGSPPTTPESCVSAGSSLATARLTVNVMTKQLPGILSPALTTVSPGLTRTRSMAASVQSIYLPAPSPVHSPEMSYKRVSMARTPLSPTTRPLNLDLPRSPDERTPRASDMSITLKSPGSTSKAGSSPALGESWDLSDLLKNGKLDLDAVSDALGLGLPTPVASSTPFNAQDNIIDANTSGAHSESVLLRKCGGPLCAIPEETDELDELSMGLRRPLSSLVERWGRVCARDSKDSADASSPAIGGSGADRMRASVSSSILNMDISLLGLDISAIKPGMGRLGAGQDESSGSNSEAWDGDISWNDGGADRSSIGLAC